MRNINSSITRKLKKNRQKLNGLFKKAVDQLIYDKMLKITNHQKCKSEPKCDSIRTTIKIYEM